MKSPVKLSVIMTVYNGEAFLQETLDAVFAQTFTDFELVVVNNGCTDGTQGILDAVADERLVVVQAPSHGTFGDGIRLAYQHARGSYLAVQDADDVSSLDRFEKQVAALDADDRLGLVVGAYQDLDAYGNLGEIHYPPENRQALIDSLQTNNFLAHSTYMYRRAASDQVGGYPAKYTYGPDFALVVRLIEKGWGVCLLQDVLLRLRLHEGQTSVSPKFRIPRAHDALYLYKEAAKLDGVSAEAQRASKRHIAKCTLRYALALMEGGKLLDGIGQLLVAVVFHFPYSVAYLARFIFNKAGLAS
ncbi:MAG TPA: glycosyltransferase [Magnetovibrio sp.]